MHRRSKPEKSMEDENSINFPQLRPSNSQQAFPSASSEAGAFYRNQYLRMCEANASLTQQIERLTLENKRLARSLTHHIHHLSVCRARLEQLGANTSTLAVGASLPKIDLCRSGSSEILKRNSVEQSTPPHRRLAGDKTASALASRRVGSISKRRRFRMSGELKGHKGAIYSVKFSPTGRFLSSGSLDKTLKLWDLGPRGEDKMNGERAGGGGGSGVHKGAMYPKPKLSLVGHAVNVSCLAWGNTDSKLLSGSYDHTVRLWDIETGKAVEIFSLPSMVQDISWATDHARSRNNNSAPNLRRNISAVSTDAKGQTGRPSGGENLFYVASSTTTILGFDRRVGPKPCHEIGGSVSGGGRINTLCLPIWEDVSCLTTGDTKGLIRAWSLRTGRCITQWKCGFEGLPISNLTPPPGMIPILVANSYDDVLRVYRLPPAIRTGKVKGLVNLNGGHRNTNWPIKSAIFSGILPNDKPILSSNQHVNTLVATGSTDGKAYIYDISEFLSPVHVNEIKESVKMHGDAEVLTGHEGRVYDVNFHPVRPLLATASEDSTIRLWLAQPTKNSKQ